MNASKGPWVTEKNKLRLALLVGIYAVVSYKAAGEVSFLRGGRALELSEIDRDVPLLPWTIWVYVSVYLTYWSSVFLQRDLALFDRFLRSYLLAYGLSAVIFVVFPTSFPRHLYPVPEVDTASGWLLHWFRATDRPTCCFPSMHVASCVMISLQFWGRRPWLFASFCLWTVAIGAATLTTKQHYFVDVVGGGLFGGLCYYWAAFWGPNSTQVPLGSSTPPAAS